jgi:hypothetical protein
MTNHLDAGGGSGESGVDVTIVRAAIHPAIGIARIGDSKSEFFVGPELVDPPPKKPDFYRDSAGALKRQAARFRIYGYNAQGQVVRELTADNASIQWTVHLANRKAQWYQFQAALDIPEAVAMTVPRAMQRSWTAAHSRSIQARAASAAAGLSRTVIPAHCGQRSGDCGQFLMSV